MSPIIQPFLFKCGLSFTFKFYQCKQEMSPDVKLKREPLPQNFPFLKNVASETGFEKIKKMKWLFSLTDLLFSKKNLSQEPHGGRESKYQTSTSTNFSFFESCWLTHTFCRQTGGVTHTNNFF